jgi:hypothetical protein
VPSKNLYPVTADGLPNFCAYAASFATFAAICSGVNVGCLAMIAGCIEGSGLHWSSSGPILTTRVSTAKFMPSGAYSLPSTVYAPRVSVPSVPPAP